MTDDQMIRARFRKADASLGHAPPDLERTLRKARRDTVRQRVFAGAGVAGVVIVAAFGAAIALRPEERMVSPIASGSPVPTAAPAPCGDLSVIGDNPNAFIDDFMRRRIAGTGAESCLTADALQLYEEQNTDPYDPDVNNGGGPLCLYSCGELRVVDYRLDTSHDADANSYEAAVILELSDGSRNVRQYEGVTFGAGVPSTSDEPQVFVVRGAWTTRPAP